MSTSYGWRNAFLAKTITLGLSAEMNPINCNNCNDNPWQKFQNEINLINSPNEMGAHLLFRNNSLPVITISLTIYLCIIICRWKFRFCLNGTWEIHVPLTSRQTREKQKKEKQIVVVVDKRNKNFKWQFNKLQHKSQEKRPFGRWMALELLRNASQIENLSNNDLDWVSSNTTVQ